MGRERGVLSERQTASARQSDQEQYNATVPKHPPRERERDRETERERERESKVSVTLPNPSLVLGCMPCNSGVAGWVPGSSSVSVCLSVCLDSVSLFLSVIVMSAVCGRVRVYGFV